MVDREDNPDPTGDETVLPFPSSRRDGDSGEDPGAHVTAPAESASGTGPTATDSGAEQETAVVSSAAVPADDAGHVEAGAPSVSLEQTRERTTWTRLPTLITFVLIYAVLLIFFRPNLLFSLTTTAGGDTGAHHYPAQYLIEHLLPHFRMTGWAPGWYAGMPMLTFYFPFPFLLIALLNVILPYTVAFKLVTVLGVFLLPLTAYAYGRLLRFRAPFPQVAAAFALLFVLMESYSIYGGNILSTLAGEFGYMLSFALVFLFLGTLHRGLERSRFDWLFALNGLILMALVLSHIVTTIALLAIAPGLLLIHRRPRAVLYMAAVFLLGFCLTAFWGLPFIDKLPWTAHMAWDQLTEFKYILPSEIRPVAALGLLGMGFAISKKDSRMLPLLWSLIVVLVLFFVLPAGRLWNARLLPFLYFTIHLWAAYGIAWLLRPFVMMFEDLLGLSARVGKRAYAPVVALVVGVVVLFGSTTAFGWIDWNYSGYEGKQSWPQYKAINDFIRSLPPGRVMTEHSQKLDKYGTPRAFEILPYWTGHPTMEGTLMEAAFTAPYHFINQAELSAEPSHAIIGVQYPPRNTAQGLTHLQLMNIPYLITISPEVTAEVEADPRADKLTKIDDCTIFRIAGTTGYVEVMKNKPVRVSTDNWREVAVPWYENPDALTVPLIWDRGEADLKDLRSISASSAANPPAEAINTDGTVVKEEIGDEKLTFETTAIGQPHWIKISYFPNWHVKGAKGPFVASPSLMMVIPTQREVTLYYGRTASNTIGQILTGLGWITVVGVVVIDRRRHAGWEGWRPKLRSEGAVHDDRQEDSADDRA